LRALRELGGKAGLTFRDANTLGRAMGRALASTLSRRLVDRDVSGRLDLIGRFLRWDWFACEAGGLKQMIDLSSVSTRYSPGSADVWLVCETAGQKQKLEAEFPRGVIAVHEGNPHVRRALIWASGGMEAPKESPLANPDFAMRLVRALAGDARRPLDAPACAQVVRAYRTLARSQVVPPWFGPEERVILTESATLESAMTPIYAGDDREVRSLLATHNPGRCLVSMVHELGGPELPIILNGLRLASPDYRRREVWVRSRYVPHGDGRVLEGWPPHRAHVVEAVRKLICDAPADLDPDQLRFELVDAIERHVESPILGLEYHVEAARFHLAASPPVLYLTSAGRVAVESELLRLVDRKKYEERELILQSLRRDWAGARVQVEDLAGDQKNCLLYNYRIAYFDPSFRKSDQELDRLHKGLEERWANFLADPGRIARVIRKHTTDLGYGKQTIARELIQNIDDAYHQSPPPGGERPWVEFREQDGALIVSHAGRRFSGEDLERICGLGGSGKSEQVQIGRFGLGFKSVLGVTAEPIVISHPYSFTIRHVVVPEWLEPEGDRCRGWHDWQRDHGLTRFVLPSGAARRDVEELSERLIKQDDLTPRVLLFLRNLEEIRVSGAGVERRIITRSDHPAPDGLFPGLERPAVLDDVKIRIRRLEVHEAGRIPSAEDFVVIEGRARIPVPDVSGMQAKPLHCGIALPWNPDEQRFGPPLGADSRLCLFLPTKTRTGLPFLVHGEFLTNLGRTDIDGENPVNAALAKALAALVHSTLESAFARWRDDRDDSRAVTRMAPWPGEVTQEAAWLRPIRGVFAEMIKSDEPVVLTIDGVLARPSECAFGRRLAHAARKPLLKADPSCPLTALVDPEIETEVGRAAAGAIRTLTGPELVKLLFPGGLKRDKATRRVRALLRVLYAQQNDDLTHWTESNFALTQLSYLPCMPDVRGGVSCPVHLENPDRAGGNADRRADLDEVAGADAEFRRWIIENLRWASSPSPSPQPPPPPVDPDEVLITSGDRKRIWAHNLGRIAGWWSGLAPQGRRDIAASYSLTGPLLWPILGLGDCDATERAVRLCGALREAGPGHERVWFRVLCLANVAQSGRRYEEGIAFLRKFDVEFGGFDRLWGAPDDGAPGDVVGGLIRRAVATYINDRSKAEQASFWRRIYDFVKIRTLLRERQFLGGFWDTADEQPEFLARYLSRGHAPGLRFEHRGLGESLSSQAFFLCRECHRLGIIHGDRARENCYAPNRHLIRFIARACGPEVGEWPDFDKYETLSHELHRDVCNHTGSRDFEDHFDLPLFHLALQDEPTRLVPGLLMRDDIEGIRRFLHTPG
jgi:hypothetical protein